MTSTSPLPDVERRRCADGVELGVRSIAGTGNLIVALHGFTGDSSTMIPLLEQCRDGRPALAIDLVGHGASDAPDNIEHYLMASVVDQVLSIIGPHEPGTVHLVGYSLGGRVALSIAARAPWYFGSITTLSATPGIEDPTQRMQRYDLDQQRSGTLIDNGIESFIDDWLAMDLFAPYLSTLSSDALAATKQQRCANTARGLANSLAGTGTGSMPPLWKVLGSIRSPMLAIAGELDPKFAEIAAQIETLAPFSQHHLVAGAGHVVHEENCADVASKIRECLEVWERHGDH